MAPFDRPYTTLNFNWLAIVNTSLIALICIIFSCLTFNNIVTLKSKLRVTQGHWKWHRSKGWVGLRFAFHSNYESILHHFGDKARYWSKIAIFSHPLHSTPPLMETQSEYCHKVWYAKLEWFSSRWWTNVWGYDYSFRQNSRTWQTLRRTDRWTPHDDGRPRLCIASRGKTLWNLIWRQYIVIEYWKRMRRKYISDTYFDTVGKHYRQYMRG